jgi:hypothetical protein
MPASLAAEFSVSALFRAPSRFKNYSAPHQGISQSVKDRIRNRLVAGQRAPHGGIFRERIMSKETKPSIVFVHGIWADGSSFSKVIPTLQAVSIVSPAAGGPHHASKLANAMLAAGKPVVAIASADISPSRPRQRGFVDRQLLEGCASSSHSRPDRPDSIARSTPWRIGRETRSAHGPRRSADHPHTRPTFSGGQAHADLKRNLAQ